MIKRYIKSCAKSLDPVLFVCTILLSIIGIVTILGQVDSLASGKRTLIMQVAMTVAGVLFTLIIANIDYHQIKGKVLMILFAASALLLIITLVFGNTGADRDSSNRSWLTIPGINIAIQPSEFVKIVTVCSFASHISTVQKKRSINHPKSIIPLLLHAGLMIGLILLSGDLGVALVYIGFIAVMLFCAGLSGWYFVGAIVALVALSPLAVKVLNEYQLQRLLVGFNPESDPDGYGMQALVSKRCIENGGFFGRGLFSGGTYERLPASHTDFIFATICEKMGMIMGLVVITILLVMVIRIFFIARSCRGEYGSYICVGVGAIILVQSVENIGMCLAMLPVVGITLPFVSYGGSSILAIFMLVALVHNVKTHRPKSVIQKL